MTNGHCLGMKSSLLRQWPCELLSRSTFQFTVSADINGNCRKATNWVKVTFRVKVTNWAKVTIPVKVTNWVKVTIRVKVTNWTKVTG